MKKIRKYLTELKSQISYKKLMLNNYMYYRRNNNKSTFKNIKKNSVFLLGTPEYGNLGDQLIALAEIELLKDYYGNDRIVEITENVIRYDFKYLKKHIKLDSLLIFQGGGNISDVWMDQEKLREKMINAYPFNKSIIMPQTVYITNKVNEEPILKKYCNINITVCAREKNTYKMLLERDNCNVILCPDIALYLWDYCKMYRENTDKSGIGICVRKDAESCKYIDVEVLCSNILNMGLDCEQFSTVKNEYILASQRDEEVNKMLSYISSKKLIITDRLHAMIMSYLTGTPCIALANSNGKVEGCYEWISSAENIYFAKCQDEVINNILDLMNKANSDSFEYKDKFVQILKEYGVSNSGNKKVY